MDRGTEGRMDGGRSLTAEANSLFSFSLSVFCQIEWETNGGRTERFLVPPSPLSSLEKSSGEEPEIHSPLFKLMPTGRRQNQKSDIDERLFLWDWTRAETRTLQRVWNASSWRKKGTSFSLSCLCQRLLRWMFVRGSVVEPLFQRGEDEAARRLF